MTVDIVGSNKQEILSFVQSLTMPTLQRIWQMLVKGLQETRSAPVPIHACQMVLLRVAYASTLPDPEELIKALQGQPIAPSQPAAPSQQVVQAMAPQITTAAPVNKEPEPAVAENKPNLSHLPQDFAALIELVSQKREPLLLAHLKSTVSLIDFAPGKMTISLNEKAPQTLPKRLMEMLKEWTNYDWQVIVSEDTGNLTLVEQEKTQRQKLVDEVSQYPIVAAALETFPDSTVETIETENTVKG